MFAIIETGGKQYKVEKGQTVEIEKLDLEVGKKVIFDKVLLVGDDESTNVGTPYVTGSVVSGKVIEQGKGDKITVFKMKPKKRYMKKQGHRQKFTAVEITTITA